MKTNQVILYCLLFLALGYLFGRCTDAPLVAIGGRGGDAITYNVKR